jgi:hypothetical protein
MRSLILLLIVIVFDTHASDTLRLNQAIKLKKVDVLAKANGGIGEHALNLLITNNLRTTLVVQFDPGMQFQSENPEVQDLIIFEDDVITLGPKEQKELNFYTACTQLSNFSPGATDLYRVASPAESILSEVAKIIGRNDFKNSTAQAAVWAVTNNYPTENLHNGDNVDLTWELATLIARNKSLQLPEREQFFSNPLPFRRIVYSARKDLVYHAPEPFKGTLGIFSSDGDLVREYFNDKPYESGLHFYSVGINNIVEENEQYTVRLTGTNGEFLVEQILDPNEPFVPAKERILSVNFEYAIRKSGQYNLAVFDNKDNLVEYIYKNRQLTPGYRPARFEFIYLDSNIPFFVFKITNTEGEVFHDQKISTNKR